MGDSTTSPARAYISMTRISSYAIAYSGTSRSAVRQPSMGVSKIQSRPPLCEERFRCRIEEKPCRQAPPARPQDARHFRQIVLDVGRQHVREDGRQKYEIERMVLVRKPKLGSSPGSSGLYCLFLMSAR